MFRKVLLALLAVFAAGMVVFAFGPTEQVDETISFDPASIGDDLDAYLKNVEKDAANLRPGAQKQIIWANPANKAATPVSIVYIHGFSATLEEIRPLPDLVARELGANLFYTRLKGHGQDGAAMAEATVNDWFNDTAEALEIGRSLGDDIVVISTSTGGTLMTWAAAKSDLMDGIGGLVLVSPNYGIQNAAAPLLTLPWARHWVPLVAGAERSFEPANEEQGKWWTTKYPSVATLPMAALVKLVAALPVEEIEIPALFVYSMEDKVVKASVTKEIAAKWGKAAENGADTIEVGETDDEHSHVVAGRILSPSTTNKLAEHITDWIRSL